MGTTTVKANTVTYFYWRSLGIIKTERLNRWEARKWNVTIIALLKGKLLEDSSGGEHQHVWKVVMERTATVVSLNGQKPHHYFNPLAWNVKCEAWLSLLLLPIPESHGATGNQCALWCKIYWSWRLESWEVNILMRSTWYNIVLSHKSRDERVLNPSWTPVTLLI